MIIGNPIMAGGGGLSKNFGNFTYTGQYTFLDDEHKILQLLDSGTLTFSKSFHAEIFLVGGGGGGGGYSPDTAYFVEGSGGGGGGGYTELIELDIPKNVEMACTIGSGGSNASGIEIAGDGGTSSVKIKENIYSALGGKGSRYKTKGGDGGSGGGGFGSSGGSINLNGGSNGSDGIGRDDNSAGVGQHLSTHAFRDDTLPWLFSGGGGGAYTSKTSSLSYNGLGGAGGGGNAGRKNVYAPGSGEPNTGGGGGASGVELAYSGAGGSGTILIRVSPKVQEV